MRSALAVGLVIAGCTGSAPAAPPTPIEEGTVFISIGADAVGTALEVAGLAEMRAQRVVETDGDVAVLAYEADQLEALAEQMHEQHGRCGGFMVHDSLDDARRSLHASAAQAPTPDYTLDRGDAVRAVLPALDRTRIVDTIRGLSQMPNRYYQSKTGAAASHWLRDRWRAFTTRDDVTIELVDHGYAQKSVVLTIPGSGSGPRANEVVVIGGHLDSIAPGGRESNAPGADDDASGVATLTEVLRVLLAADWRPERTVKFMAYAAEEVGLRGSLSIAKDFKKREVDVVGALQLDMTNYQGSDRDIWLIDDFTSPAQNRFLVQLLETYVDATWGVDRCGYACSDHAAWHRNGYPASMPFEARFRDHNKQIHTKRDTLETSDANAAHALKFAHLAAAYALELGKGELGASSAPRASAKNHGGQDCGGGTRWLLVVLALGLALALLKIERSHI
jgi:leucyl aminopeptidase